jgi:hypothetical protein
VIRPRTSHFQALQTAALVRGVRLAPGAVVQGATRPCRNTTAAYFRCRGTNPPPANAGEPRPSVAMAAVTAPARMNELMALLADMGFSILGSGCTLGGAHWLIRVIARNITVSVAH